MEQDTVSGLLSISNVSNVHSYTKMIARNVIRAKPLHLRVVLFSNFYTHARARARIFQLLLNDSNFFKYTYQ